MTAEERRVPVGRVGRPHGYDGSFYVEGASHLLPLDATVTVRGRELRVERRAGTDARPLVRLSGISSREEAAALRAEPLSMPAAEAPLEDGEWLTEDLVGCEVPGVGTVARLISAPSCDLLVVGPEEVLIPLVSDAVRRVDVEGRVIEVNLEFLGLGGDEAGASP